MLTVLSILMYMAEAFVVMRLAPGGVCRYFSLLSNAFECFILNSSHVLNMEVKLLLHVTTGCNFIGDLWTFGMPQTSETGDGF